MVKVEIVEEKDTVASPYSSPSSSRTSSSVSLSSVDSDASADESFFDRISALKDIVPPTTRHSISTRITRTASLLKRSSKVVGNIVWVVTTSALLVGLPLALALEDEAKIAQQEKEMLEQQQGAQHVCPWHPLVVIFINLYHFRWWLHHCTLSLTIWTNQKQLFLQASNGVVENIYILLIVILLLNLYAFTVALLPNSPSLSCLVPRYYSSQIEAFQRFSPVKRVLPNQIVMNNIGLEFQSWYSWKRLVRIWKTRYLWKTHGDRYRTTREDGRSGMVLTWNNYR